MGQIKRGGGDDDHVVRSPLDWPIYASWLFVCMITDRTTEDCAHHQNNSFRLDWCCAGWIIIPQLEKIMTYDDDPKIAVIYSRSATSHGKNENITLQRQECEEYAKIHGYKILGSFIDVGCSGIELEKRNGWFDMIKFLENTPGCAVLVDNMARVARNYNLCDQLICQLKLLGAELILIHNQDVIETYDLKNIVSAIKSAIKRANYSPFLPITFICAILHKTLI